MPIYAHTHVYASVCLYVSYMPISTIYAHICLYTYVCVSACLHMLLYVHLNH